MGAVANGLVEKYINWDIANKLKSILDGYDAKTVIVQPGAEFISTGEDELYLPPQRANEMGADFYLSLHINAGGGEGFESYIHPAANGEEADRIRGIIHYHVFNYLRDRGIEDRGKKYANYAVLRLTKMPAVLLEYVFIDDPEEASLLRDPIFRWGLALSTAKGVVQAFNLKPA